MLVFNSQQKNSGASMEELLATSAWFESILTEVSSGREYLAMHETFNFSIPTLFSFCLLLNLRLHSVGSKVWFPSSFETGLLYKCKCAKKLFFFFQKEQAVIQKLFT